MKLYFFYDGLVYFYIYMLWGIDHKVSLQFGFCAPAMLSIQKIRDTENYSRIHTGEKPTSLTKLSFDFTTK